MTADAAATAAATNGQVAAQMRAIVDEVGAQFLERSEPVRALAVAMLAGQHSLVLGPPGTGKSAMARALTARIDGARYWEILLSKFTSPVSIFGPIDVAKLTQGTYTQLFDGRATTAHVAFIDEIFKCSTASLNAMLSFLNERVYHPEAGGEPRPCPLISAVCASNELPSGEDSAALYDRLTVRLVVDYLADPSNFAALLRTAVDDPSPAAPTTVDLVDLQAAVASGVPAVKLPDGVIDDICTLRAQLRRKELVSSDRRWKQAVRLVQASAFLAGRESANKDDLLILRHVLWDEVTERPQVERTVLELVHPDAAKALDLLDAVAELEAQLESKAGQSKAALTTWATKEANGKLNKTLAQLRELIKQSETAGRPTSSLQSALERTTAVQVRVMVEALGVDATIAKSMLSGK
jgi:MoxR-like ATPase